jgi:oxygen-independent coproporphyrinogen-3 oxidase
MQGLYIHIPFCAQACHYCDFHFSTNITLKAEMVNAICQEIALRADYLNQRTIDTIYLGGGTPSLLDEADLDLIFNTIHKHFQVIPGAEITLEANPDDLKADKVQSLVRVGFNRLSIGVQSFNDGHLQYLHRLHSAIEAQKSIKRAQDAGFSNISLDLIYGIPSERHDIWQQDLDAAFALNCTHISSYCLTIEPNTVFGKWVKTKKIKEVDEEFSARQFEMLISNMEMHGFEHYEISNFSKPGLHSRHNSNYWLGAHYLGVGPSAHSFNGGSRQYNLPNNITYIRNIKDGKVAFDMENLSIKDRINEYLMTRIRTKWGCDFNVLKQDFGADMENFDSIIELYQKDGFVEYHDGILTLTRSGKLIADRITSDFFII